MNGDAPRAVFDCVIFAQALINFRSPAGECFRAAERGECIVHVSEIVLAEVCELPRKLKPRLGVTSEHMKWFLEYLEQFVVFVERIPRVYHHPIDPDDSHYVDLAEATRSPWIVSRDRHLLNLMDSERAEGKDFRRRFPGLSIVPPEAFVGHLRMAG